MNTQNKSETAQPEAMNPAEDASANQGLLFESAVEMMFEKLGTHKVMALASGVNDHIMVRNVSCILYDHRIFFKTDKNFRKTKQILINPNVAICDWGVQIEGRAVNHGSVVEEPGKIFEGLYKKYWEKSYTAYAHEDTEILIEVIPTFVEIWDQDDEDKGFQTLIDYETREVSVEYYD
jgi:uncharacterized pyridoxamine 5'-phosphate oxidase family protein